MKQTTSGSDPSLFGDGHDDSTLGPAPEQAEPTCVRDAALPSFVGSAPEIAIERIRELGLIPAVEPEDVDDAALHGSVTSQSPSAGMAVRRGSIVELGVGRARPTTPPSAPKVVPDSSDDDDGWFDVHPPEEVELVDDGAVAAAATRFDEADESDPPEPVVVSSRERSTRSAVPPSDESCSSSQRRADPEFAFGSDRAGATRRLGVSDRLRVVLADLAARPRRIAAVGTLALVVMAVVIAATGSPTPREERNPTTAPASAPRRAPRPRSSPAQPARRPARPHPTPSRPRPRSPRTAPRRAPPSSGRPSRPRVVRRSVRSAQPRATERAPAPAGCEFCVEDPLHP
jgi:hypothetical protein